MVSEFIKRTISGTIYVILILGALLSGKHVYFSLLLILNTLGLIEFYRITSNKPINLLSVNGILSGTIIITGFHLYYIGIFNSLFFLAIIILSVFVLFFFVLNNQYTFSDMAKVLTGLIYISLPLALSLAINYTGSGSYNPYVMIMVFALIWTNDTGAYLVGIAIGKHKIWPSISPKKSWEGFAGGLLITVLIVFLLNKWLQLIGFSPLTLLGLALITGLFSVLGDFMESAIKRYANMKDSGNIIPGHGGVLDRIDSLICVTPFVFLYLQCLIL